MVEAGRAGPGSPPARVSLAQENDPESPSFGKRPGPWPPQVGASPTDEDNNAKLKGNWARRTGFKSTGIHSTSSDFGLAPSSALIKPNVSVVAESNKTSRPPPPLPKPPIFAKKGQHFDIESGTATTSSSSGATNNVANANVAVADRVRRSSPPLQAPDSVPSPTPIVARRDAKGASNHDKNTGVLPNSGQNKLEPTRVPLEVEQDISSSHDGENAHSGHSHLKYELRETPGLFFMLPYALQHYFSMIGSIILIPLVIVPAMKGSDEDTAKVVSTVLLVSGISTILHSWFGSRLPLVQGASFVYLAPVLIIIFSEDHSSSKNEFKDTMRELQGAMILGSIFQIILGYSGMMSLLLRLVNPVVIAPTIASVGLAFFSYGFSGVGTCVEIGIPQIVVVVIFALHLRKVSILGHRICQIYAVPLGLAITWAYAFLLTEIGRYNYNGCDMYPGSSRSVSAECEKHIYTMQHCRTDTSMALESVAWFRVPYPFQWGLPIFSFRSAALIVVASIIASVDSVGTYHGTSLFVASKPPSPRVVSRGVGLEGLTSLLAGIWGTGTGMSTLTENVHTVAVTKIGSRRTVEIGACVLIVLSFIGKVGAFIASIPQAIVAGLLCFIWSMLVALGLSKLRYSETRSSRNMLIVGLSLLLSLSVPSYVQQYAGRSITHLERQYQPYAVGGNGPIRTGAHSFNHFVNNILSMHMIIAFVVALILDNTVPGSRQERGTYTWSSSVACREESAVFKDYSLPFGLSRFFMWIKWVGV